MNELKPNQSEFHPVQEIIVTGSVTVEIITFEATPPKIETPGADQPNVDIKLSPPAAVPELPTPDLLTYLEESA